MWWQTDGVTGNKIQYNCRDAQRQKHNSLHCHYWFPVTRLCCPDLWNLIVNTYKTLKCQHLTRLHPQYLSRNGLLSHWQLSSLRTQIARGTRSMEQFMMETVTYWAFISTNRKKRTSCYADSYEQHQANMKSDWCSPGVCPDRYVYAATAISTHTNAPATRSLSAVFRRYETAINMMRG